MRYWGAKIELKKIWTRKNFERVTSLLWLHIPSVSLSVNLSLKPSAPILSDVSLDGNISRFTDSIKIEKKFFFKKIVLEVKYSARYYKQVAVLVKFKQKLRLPEKRISKVFVYSW